MHQNQAHIDQSNVIAREDFTPFGSVMAGSEQANNTNVFGNRFTGHERDEQKYLSPLSNQGLDYMLARNYDPVLGRFLSVDPLADKYPSHSPYNYVMNNPLIMTDPTGEYIIDSNGNRVEVTTKQDEDGNYVNSYNFAEGTEQSIIDDFHANGGIILDAMVMTEEGRTQLGNLEEAEHSIELNLSDETFIHKNGSPRLGYTEIKGAKLKSDGSIDLSNASTTITVYEGSINEMSNLNYEGKWGEFKSMGKTGMIGATGSHETVHATSKQNMKLSASKSSDVEDVLNDATFRYVRQFLKSDKK